MSPFWEDPLWAFLIGWWGAFLVFGLPPMFGKWRETKDMESVLVAGVFMKATRDALLLDAKKHGHLEESKRRMNRYVQSTAIELGDVDADYSVDVEGMLENAEETAEERYEG